LIKETDFAFTPHHAAYTDYEIYTFATVQV